MKYLIILIACIGIVACSDDDPSIEAYIIEKNLSGFESTPEGLYYKIDNPGSDLKPSIGDSCYIHYIGYYTDEVEFQNSYNSGQPLGTILRGVIAGWRIGIPLFGEGGSGTLIIPPSLGYGKEPNNGIRKNAILLFDIEVMEVIK